MFKGSSTHLSLPHHSRQFKLCACSVSFPHIFLPFRLGYTTTSDRMLINMSPSTEIYTKSKISAWYTDTWQSPMQFCRSDLTAKVPGEQEAIAVVTHSSYYWTSSANRLKASSMLLLGSYTLTLLSKPDSSPTSLLRVGKSIRVIITVWHINPIYIQNAGNSNKYCMHLPLMIPEVCSASWHRK